MRRKHLCYTLIMLTPGIILTGLIVLTVLDLISIRSIDPQEMRSELQAHLATKEPTSFPPPDSFPARDASRKLVYLFGESSLMITDGMTFPDYLQRDHDDLQVVNFGMSGIDSFSVRKRVEEALAAARPDIMVLYYGHNDYNNAYQGFILPKYYEKFNALLRLSYLFRIRDKPRGVMYSEEYYWYAALIRPQLYWFFEKIGVLNINARDFEPLNDSVLEHFVKNTRAIIELAAAQRIPVVMITPVGNLRAEPFGDLEITTASYQKGMASRDYAESLAYLKQARDSEILTYDLRAKSPLVDHVRSLASRRGVKVLDLERVLEERRSGFGYEEFLDYFHFNDRSHRLLADLIYDFLQQHRLVRLGPAHRRPAVGANEHPSL
jgi:lysophospholipase L1-like esterase